MLSMLLRNRLPSIIKRREESENVHFKKKLDNFDK